MKSYSKVGGGPTASIHGVANGAPEEHRVAADQPSLSAPDTVRVPLPEPVGPMTGARETPSTVTVRTSARWSKRGKRMARFRTERLQELKHREAEALRGAVPVITHHVGRLRPRSNDPAWPEMLRESGEALTAALQSALQSARLNRLAVMVEDFRQSGFHHLLTEMLVRGNLTSSMAKAHRDQLKKNIDDRSLSGDAVKRGFLVFDGLAQRLALLTPELQYDIDGAPRVFLETYAGSFHRG